MKGQYAIFRMKKYKSQTISMIEAHNERMKEAYASKESVTRRLELLQQVQELEKLRKIVDNIPDEILAVYNNPKSERKDKTVAYE